MSPTTFFAGWAGVLRVLIVGIIAYAALVALLRLGGKRTLARMNAFDFIVTVSFGSTLSATMLSRDVPLVEGVTALALLVGLQYAVAWTEVRHGSVRALVTSQPTLLAWHGQRVVEAMQRERIGEDDLLAAARGGGVLSIRDIEAAILETDGSISVVPRHRNRVGAKHLPLGRRLEIGGARSES